MMETRSVSVGMAPHHQHQHLHQKQPQHQQQQPHSILKKPSVTALVEPVPVPAAQQTGPAQSPVAQVDLSGGGRGTAASRPSQPPPAEFADVAAQCYHPGGSIVGIVGGTSSTLPRPPPPPKCPRPDHHHHHHGGHHHPQQHLHGTIRRHATGPSSTALPACTCSTGTVAGGQLQPPHHTSSGSLAADAAAAKTVAAAAAAAEELHV